MSVFDVLENSLLCVREDVAAAFAGESVFRVSGDLELAIHPIDDLRNERVIARSEVDDVAIVLVLDGELVAMGVEVRMAFGPILFDDYEFNFLGLVILHCVLSAGLRPPVLIIRRTAKFVKHILSNA